MKHFQCLLLQTVFPLALAFSASAAAPPAGQVKSPDGKVALEFLLQADGAPAYTISFLGKPVVLESRLGFEPGLTNGFQLVKSSSSSHHGEWTNNFGERKIIPDNYGELEVGL
ncbi:MAG TPA: glycoside hydrolase family 97 N-terminal domain-containing protein, partial [Candidatus Acidoferrum sp.]|nr:glycoside hydrolase family 97 N-terminal domain-containing protein [Candidatus Acidoferrum sp.]